MRRSHDQSETDSLLRASAREFAREREETRADAADSWRAFVEAGWPGMGLEEDSGGLGADLHQCCLVLQEAGRALLVETAATDILVAPRLAQRAPAIAALMPDLLEGRARFALAGQGDTGFSLGADGRVTGRSALVPGADRATHVLFLAGSGESASLCLAERGTAGLRIHPAPLLDGRTAARIDLDAADTGNMSVLFSGREACDIAAELEALLLCGVASEGLGAFEAAFEMTADYVQTRQQFRQPLASFQAVEHTIADVYCELEKFRSLHMAMVSALSAGGTPVPQAVAHARLFHASDVVRAVGRLIQITGGIAVTEEYKLGRIYRRLQTDAALFGGPRRPIETLAGTPMAKPASFH